MPYACSTVALLVLYLPTFEMTHAYNLMRALLVVCVCRMFALRLLYMCSTFALCLPYWPGFEPGHDLGPEFTLRASGVFPTLALLLLYFCSTCAPLARIRDDPCVQLTV